MVHVTNHHWSKNIDGPSFACMTHTSNRVGGGPAWLDRAHRGRFGTRLRVPKKVGTALAALAALVAVGCAHPETRSTPMTEQARDQNKQNVGKLFESFNQDDLGLVDQLIGPDYVGPQGDRGPAGFKAIIAGLRTSFPDLRYTVDDLVGEGDQVAIRWHWTGTFKEPFRGIQATGKPVLNTGTAIFRLKDGKIVSATLETDRLGFLEQIGAVPPNAGRGPRPPAPPHP
jgi:predicted ester cyclase